MFRKKLKTLLLFFVVGLVGTAWGSEIKLPVPETEILPNGLQLVWFLNDKIPVIDFGLMIKSGDRDNPPGKTGVAELLASSMDRGAGGMSARDLARAVEMLGASRSISSSEDSFNLTMHGLAGDAETLLDLLAKVSLTPEFPEAEVKREKARLLDRWNHLGDSSDILASVTYHRIIAAGSDYGRGAFLSIREFDRVAREDVIAFYKTHFTPKNAVLTIVGRAKKEELRNRILNSFGKWQGEEPEHHWTKFSDPRVQPKKGEIVVVDRPGLTQAQVRIGFKGPTIRAPEHLPLSVANALLGEYFHSRLNSVIRDKLGLTYSIGSSFAYAKDFGSFTIASASRNETVGQLIQKTYEILKELKYGKIPDEEVQMAKDYITGGFPLSVSTLNAVASRWLGAFYYGLGQDYLNNYVEKIRPITAKEISEAVRADFDLEHLVTVVAGDGKEVAKSLQKSKLKKIKRVSVKDLM